MNSSDLTGKVAVVTGAGGVLCGDLAKALAKAGATVVLLDIHKEAAQSIAAAICGNGGTAKAYACDVLQSDACEEIARRVLAEYGPCDFLINGAGGNHPCATTDHEYMVSEDLRDDVKSFFNLKEDGFRFVFDLNVLGTLIPTQVFARHMLGREGCCILNVSSMNAYTPLTKIPAYSAAKAAVSNLTQWLAVHFSKVGIRVNAIAPGFFATKQNADLLWKEDGSPTPRTEKILHATPMGRLGDSKELIGAMLFLVDEQASGFVTGVVLPVDGGFSAYSGV